MVKGASWNDAHEAIKQSNGDIGRAETALRTKNQIMLHLINPGEKRMQCKKTFNLEDTGMEIVTHLMQTFPPPQGMCVNLFRFENQTGAITYTDLSQSIRNLNFQPDSILWFVGAQQPNF